MPEAYCVVCDCFKVFFCFGGCWCAQSLVVFYPPETAIRDGFKPSFVIRDREEALWIITLGSFDNRCDKLFEKPPDFQKARPEVMNEVDEETFDVGAVVVLVGHDHDWTVPEFTDVGVDFTHV